MSEFCPYTYKGYPRGLEYPWTFTMPSIRERDRRWAEIRKSMSNHNIDCLIIGAPWGYMPSTSNTNICYVSNYAPASNRGGTYIVFPQKGEPQLGVSNQVGPQFLHFALATSWMKEVIGSFYPVKDIIMKINQSKLSEGKIGVVDYSSGMFAASVYDTLRENFPTASFSDATVVLAAAMNEVSRTSHEELALLHKVCEIQDLGYEAVVKAFKPGVKECELWAVAEHAIVKNGGWYPHFILGTSGPSPTFPRAPASQNVLSKGDIVLFEINVIYGGISAQISYAISLGRPKKEIEDMFEFCSELYAYTLEELEKQRTFLDIELDLANRIHKAGYEPMTPQIHIYNQSTSIPNNSPPQPGDYFTVHPNFCTKDYTSGAKFGETVRISEQGKVQRLQKTPAKLNII